MKITSRLAPETRRQDTAHNLLKLAAGIEAAIAAQDREARTKPATARDIAKNERAMAHLIVALSTLTGREPSEIRRKMQEQA